MDKTYTIGEVCSQFGLKEQSLRYLEKSIKGAIEIKRDNFNNRVYTEKDLQKIETILSLKEQGLNYPKIKELLEKNEIVPKDEAGQTADTENAVSQKSDERFNTLITTLQADITESVTNAVSEQVESLKNDVGELKKQNELLMKQLDGYFRNFDEKLEAKREKLSKKSLFKRIFHID